MPWMTAPVPSDDWARGLRTSSSPPSAIASSSHFSKQCRPVRGAMPGYIPEWLFLPASCSLSSAAALVSSFSPTTTSTDPRQIHQTGLLPFPRLRLLGTLPRVAAPPSRPDPRPAAERVARPKRQTAKASSSCSCAVVGVLSFRPVSRIAASRRPVCAQSHRHRQLAARSGSSAVITTTISRPAHISASSLSHPAQQEGFLCAHHHSVPCEARSTGKHRHLSLSLPIAQNTKQVHRFRAPTSRTAATSCNSVPHLRHPPNRATPLFQ